MDTTKEYLSKEKFEELKTELDQLTRITRREIAETLEAAKALGDLSENAEYHSAREQQAGGEERIMDLEELLKNDVLVPGKHKTDMVGVGAEVVVKRGKDTKTYKIVGSEEANISEGKISNKSPLGEAMMGKKKGDSFSYMTPSGAMKCEILEIK